MERFRIVRPPLTPTLPRGGARLKIGSVKRPGSSPNGPTEGLNGSVDEPAQQLGGRTARQDLRSVAQLDQEAPRVERTQELDRFEIDDVRAMDLQEELGVQAFRQLAEARVE